MAKDGFAAFVKVRGKNEYRPRTEAEIAALQRRRSWKQAKLRRGKLRVIIPANDP
jgi:hypothetical protein